MNELGTIEKVLSWWLGFHLKGVFLCGLTLVLVRLLHSRSAALRHLCLFGGALAVLLVGLLSLLPFRTVPLRLPDANFLSHSLLPAAVGPALRLLEEPERSALKVTAAGQELGDGRGVAATVRPAIEIEAGGRSRLDRILLGIWGFGLLVGLFRVAAGEIWLRRLLAGTSPAADNGLRQLVRHWARQSGIRRRQVAVRLSPQTASPFVRKTLRPLLVLPAGYTGWPSRRLDRILVHELGHISRLDSLSLTLVRLSVLLQWMNPLAWILLRRVREEQELACDDRVLAARLSGSSFATDLLWLARNGGGFGWEAGVLGKTSALETRLKALLDGTIDHRPLGRVPALSALLITAATALLLGGMARSGPSPEPAMAREWATLLDSGRIRFSTEETIALEGIGTLRGSSRDRVLDFSDPVQLLVDGAPAAPGTRLQADQEVTVQSEDGDNLWNIHLASTRAPRPRKRTVGSARGTHVSFVFEPGEASFYLLRFRDNQMDIRGWVLEGSELGVRFDAAGEEPGRIRVRALLVGSPAERAGLRVGDLVTSISGQPATLEALFRSLLGKPPGTRISCRVERAGRVFTLILETFESNGDPAAESWRGQKYKTD